MDIKAIYRAIALRTHPDKVGIGKEELFKRASMLYQQASGNEIQSDESFDAIFAKMHQQMDEILASTKRMNAMLERILNETDWDAVRKRLEKKEHV
jgi:curved DNA-binding protein CbpA